MEIKMEGSLALFTFLFSAILTGLCRLFLLNKSILDIPNERSSHNTPTPRGGGLAIVIIFIISLFELAYFQYINLNLILAISGGGILIAITGYCDDLYSVKARWRILLHFLASIWAIYWLGGFPVLNVGTSAISLHWAGSLFAIIGLIWFINFYNFMDGIDGLAGTEGIFVSVSSGLALLFLGAHHLALVMFLLAASIGGFTVWNWPPAKIFLGDVGSGFLGFVFGVLAIYTAKVGYLPLTFWLIILGIFVCDATFTLLLRISQGKTWYSAHREHAYQHLIAYGANHKQVTLSILLINICILMPIAFASLYWPATWGFLIICLLVGLCFTWSRIKLLPI